MSQFNSLDYLNYGYVALPHRPDATCCCNCLQSNFNKTNYITMDKEIQLLSHKIQFVIHLLKIHFCGRRLEWKRYISTFSLGKFSLWMHPWNKTTKSKVYISVTALYLLVIFHYWLSTPCICFVREESSLQMIYIIK